MPTRATNPETGERGFVHVISGKPRFIADDPAFSPAAGVGPFGAALIGFGETLTNTGLRAQAAVDTLAGRQNTEAQNELSDVKSLLGPLEDDHFFATAVGQSVPGFFLPASKAVQTVGGVAEGVLADPENPILSGLIGGAGGFIGGALGQKLGTAIQAKVGGAVGRLAARNIPTTLAQRTDSVTEQGIEAGLAAIPVISRWASRPARAQQRALNTGAASVFGYEGKLTAKGLGDVKFGVQKSFQEVQAAIPDTKLSTELVKQIDELGAIDTATKEFLESTSGIADGEALMFMRSNLNDDMADAFLAGNRKEGRKIRAVLNEVDSIIERGIGLERKQQWATARKQWQFLTAISKGKAISGTGDVNLATMRNNLNKVYPSFRFGGDLPATAQGFGELVTALDQLPKALQSSGTAERAAAATLITNPLRAAAAIPTAILPAARAVGQPGTDVGATLGIAAAQTIEDNLISEALAEIMAERARSGDVD